ncbi:uncharacterized protein FIESC28_00437 [Fusarium coffeatum]|uniref:Uncharacterized protein n=1 Tax=Fusarium coffeatum TaxID=231269 RepID=A0A366SDW6_9HYPO|nr:uncharacterized protein FIESC28_00437 [Fusarium coffeatum]RBR26856.1 hypothetical protein FIESC28_00437 [Fusarium coffeatum]
MKRKRSDTKALDQTSHPTSLSITSHRSEPKKMEDDSSDSAPSVPGITQAKPWLSHKTLNPSDNDMPASLKALYMRLLPIQRDKNIMPRSCKETLEWKSKSIYQILDADAYYDRPSLGPDYAKQLLGGVEGTVSCAKKCHSRQYDKTGWNTLVYPRIINAAIRGVNTGRGHWHLDFAPCERAVVEPFLSKETSDQALRGLQTHFDPANFMAFKPTHKYPIVLGIKSKELHGEDPVSPEHHLAA